jgi:hypothetical protein
MKKAVDRMDGFEIHGRKIAVKVKPLSYVLSVKLFPEGKA